MALPPPLPEAEKAPEKVALGFEGGGGKDGHEDDGDGGGGGGDGEPPRRDDFPIGRAKLAMVFVLASLSVLFIVTLFVALLLRRSAAHWNPGVAPAFPQILWANTLVLFASSATLRRAVRAMGEGDARTLTRGIAATTLLGAAFLAGQAWAWHDLLRAGVTMEGAYGTVFYWLTGLHAAHVLGGLVLLAVCQTRALLGRYTRESHLGVELCEIYWHFLGAVWLVLVALLFALL
jgi:cytochrome c oxidase subunit 3